MLPQALGMRLDTLQQCGKIMGDFLSRPPLSITEVMGTLLQKRLREQRGLYFSTRAMGLLGEICTIIGRQLAAG